VLLLVASHVQRLPTPCWIQGTLHHNVTGFWVLHANHLYTIAAEPQRGVEAGFLAFVLKLCVHKKESAELTWAVIRLLCDVQVVPAAFHAQIVSLAALLSTQAT
jgi:hypothetical protein